MKVLWRWIEQLAGLYTFNWNMNKSLYKSCFRNSKKVWTLFFWSSFLLAHFFPFHITEMLQKIYFNFGVNSGEFTSSYTSGNFTHLSDYPVSLKLWLVTNLCLFKSMSGWCHWFILIFLAIDFFSIEYKLNPKQ